MKFWKRVDLLDQPLIQLTATDVLTLRDFAAGTLVLGMTGSGKSTGPRDNILRTFVRKGMGGVLTTVKPEDVEDIRRICKEEGREDSLLIWNGLNGGFNFLEWILAREGASGIENAIEFLMRVIELKKATAAVQAGAGEQFWLDTVLQFLRALIPLIHAGTGTLRIDDILRSARSAPTSLDQMKDPAWQANSDFYKMCALAADKLDDATGARLMAYWQEFTALDGKTRSNILISLTTALDALVSNAWLRNAFCEGSSIFPELCFEGVIIVLDMPVLTRHEDGLFAQQIFVLAYQRAVLARNALSKRYRERPVFLIIDEFPLFSNPYYTRFLGLCRSSNCCTVLLAQSVPSIEARMTGPNGAQQAQSLFANCAIKIWAANNCTVTNEWASKTIGRTLQTRSNYSANEGHNANFGMNMGEGTNYGWSSQSGGNSSSSSNGGSSSGSSWSSGTSGGGSDNHGRNRGSGSSHGQSWGHNEVLEFAVEPGEFGRVLKTGGPSKRVSTIIYQAGRTFSSGGNALLVEWRQS
jgi:type IV secretory pathway TraG/TraD family ATPase VirD4